MADGVEPTRPALQAGRERTIELLCRHVAHDALTLEEFERRVDRAHRALAQSELDALLADLPALQDAGAARPLHAPPPRPAPGEQRDRQVLAAIMGGTVRRGTWTPARHTTVVTFMGGAELDFREARFASGVTELTVIAVWGGVEIIVPPGLAVEAGGIAIMGGFDHADQAPAAREPDAPLLRINGIALMGGVEVRVRFPGENERDARRRRKEERRRLDAERKRLGGG